MKQAPIAFFRVCRHLLPLIAPSGSLGVQIAKKTAAKGASSAELVEN
jgi:hypothetical protein